MAKLGSDLETEIQNVRDRIVATKDSLEELAHTSVPLEEALKRLDRTMATAGSTPALGAFFAADGDGPSLRGIGLHDDLRGINRGDDHVAIVGANRALEVLVWLLRDHIRDTLAEMLRQHPLAREAGLSPQDRKAKQTKLTAELFELERREEALICRAESQRIEILRRPDADPRAVLVTDDALS